MQLSIQQTQELLKIIDKNQLAILGMELGANFLTEYDKQLLNSYGINPETLYQPHLSSIETSFHFGMLADALGVLRAKSITYSDIKNYVKEGRYIPLSQYQKDVLNSIKMQTFSSLRSLSGNIFADVNNILIDKTKAGQQQFLADELKRGLEQRKTVSQIAHTIAEKTGDWNRNFGRIIETASQSAFQQGVAADIERKNPGRDPLVYKQCQNGACKHCIRLYLTNGMGSKPIIFKLSELRANGSNVGRKVSEWKAVVETTHPFCRCPLQEVPEGMLWNDETKTFSKPDPYYKKQIAAKRPLFKVTIGNISKYV